MIIWLTFFAVFGLGYKHAHMEEPDGDWVVSRLLTQRMDIYRYNRQLLGEQTMSDLFYFILFIQNVMGVNIIMVTHGNIRRF